MLTTETLQEEWFQCLPSYVDILDKILPEAKAKCIRSATRRVVTTAAATITPILKT